MTVAALNFKKFDKGALKGFFDLRYFGLVVKNVRLMSGSNGLWVALPQQKGEQDGEPKWFDQMFLTKPEAEHVRRLVLADLQAQGYLEAPANGIRGNGQCPMQKTPEGEDVSEYYSNGADDDISF